MTTIQDLFAPSGNPGVSPDMLNLLPQLAADRQGQFGYRTTLPAGYDSPGNQTWGNFYARDGAPPIPTAPPPAAPAPDGGGGSGGGLPVPEWSGGGEGTGGAQALSGPTYAAGDFRPSGTATGKGGGGLFGDMSYGMGGSILGGLIGMPFGPVGAIAGLAGNAIGTGIDVRNENRNIESWGIPNLPGVNYGSAFARNNSLGAIVNGIANLFGHERGPFQSAATQRNDIKQDAGARGLSAPTPGQGQKDRSPIDLATALNSALQAGFFPNPKTMASTLAALAGVQQQQPQAPSWSNPQSLASANQSVADTLQSIANTGYSDTSSYTAGSRGVDPGVQAAIDYAASPYSGYMGPSADAPAPDAGKDFSGGFDTSNQTDMGGGIAGGISNW